MIPWFWRDFRCKPAEINYFWISQEDPHLPVIQVANCDSAFHHTLTSNPSCCRPEHKHHFEGDDRRADVTARTDAPTILLYNYRVHKLFHWYGQHPVQEQHSLDILRGTIWKLFSWFLVMAREKLRMSMNDSQVKLSLNSLPFFPNESRSQNSCMLQFQSKFIPPA